MKKKESLLSKKFDKNTLNNLAQVFGGRPNATEGTGECHGTGCSEATGKTDTKPGVTDWEDIECGDDTIDGSLSCPV